VTTRAHYKEAAWHVNDFHQKNRLVRPFIVDGELAGLAKL
jgi:hypothetical protein